MLQSSSNTRVTKALILWPCDRFSDKSSKMTYGKRLMSNVSVLTTFRILMNKKEFLLSWKYSVDSWKAFIQTNLKVCPGSLAKSINEQINKNCLETFLFLYFCMIKEVSENGNMIVSFPAHLGPAPWEPVTVQHPSAHGRQYPECAQVQKVPLTDKPRLLLLFLLFSVEASWSLLPAPPPLYPSLSKLCTQALHGVLVSCLQPSPAKVPLPTAPRLRRVLL